ncbi:MAG: hypothetical protein ACK53A_11145 [Gemmatimonadota bacterium]
MTTSPKAEVGAAPAFAVSSLDALNLGKLAAAGVWCALRHPVTGAPLVTPEGAPIRLKLAGMDAPVAKAAAARLSALPKDAPTAELEAALRQQVIDCTLEWEGVPLEFSPANVAAFYAAWDWAEGQALETIAARDRYLGN